MFRWFIDASRRLRQAFQISIDRSMELAFYKATLLADRYRGGGFFGDHCSWNRNPRSGYKVIFAPHLPAAPVRHAVHYSQQLRRWEQ
jgi:hypothetical protein